MIQKAPETMSSRERVARTFNYERTDRVPIGVDTNAGILARLCAALQVPDGDLEAVYRALGVDTRSIAPAYIGSQLHQIPEGREIYQLEGSIMRWVEHQTGGYWDFCDFPLKDADEAAFDAFPVPNPDEFDYDGALEQAKSYGDEFALYCGNPGMPDIINSNGRLMGMEDVLCHLMTEEDYMIRFINRRVDFQLGMLERLLEKCKGMFTYMWLGEDLGTQIAPMVSLDLYRRVLKPIHKKFVDLASLYHLPVMVHTCGSSSWVYEDFIKMGVRGVDTLQPEAVNMSPPYLTEHFGGRLNFRGCISTAGPLAYGTVEDIKRVCAETLETMMARRGYHFAPTHAIQDNTPVENVLAMYQCAHELGRYR